MARRTTRSESHVDVSEASALARLADGRFLVADDELGLVLAEAGGTARQLEPESGEALDDVEGLCLTSDGKAALVVSETHGDVHRIPLIGRGAGLRLGVAEHLGSLPRLAKGKKGKRKGWEGLALLPARFAPGRRECLVAVHEARPRMVGLFAFPSLEVIALLDPPAGADELSDLSDVAVDPRSGRLVLLSDESQRIILAQLESGDRLVTVGEVDLPLKRREKPEGVDVDPRGSLWVVCDGTGRLLELELPG